jgi:hypothetical protein
MIKAKYITKSIQETLSAHMVDPWLDHLKGKHPMVVGNQRIIRWIDTEMRDYFLNDYPGTRPDMDMELEAHKVFSYLTSEEAPHNLDN